MKTSAITLNTSYNGCLKRLNNKQGGDTMKKLNNQDVVKAETSFAAATGMCPNNCNACQPSGCACTKCYDCF